MDLITIGFAFLVAGIVVLVYGFLIDRFAVRIGEPAPVRRFPISKGMKVYKCNLNDPEYLVVEAEIAKVELKNGVVSHQVVMEENCIYELAINTENAVRKMEKRIIASLKK